MKAKQDLHRILPKRQAGNPPGGSQRVRLACSECVTSMKCKSVTAPNGESLQGPDWHNFYVTCKEEGGILITRSATCMSTSPLTFSHLLTSLLTHEHARNNASA